MGVSIAVMSAGIVVTLTAYARDNKTEVTLEDGQKLVCGMVFTMSPFILLA